MHAHLGRVHDQTQACTGMYAESHTGIHCEIHHYLCRHVMVNRLGRVRWQANVLDCAVEATTKGFSPAPFALQQQVQLTHHSTTVENCTQQLKTVRLTQRGREGIQTARLLKDVFSDSAQGSRGRIQDEGAAAVRREWKVTITSKVHRTCMTLTWFLGKTAKSFLNCSA